MSDGETVATREETLVPKKGGTSVIWNWFSFKSSDTEQTSTLSKVFRRVVTANGGNTSNLFHHLKNKHTPVNTKRQTGPKRAQVGPAVTAERVPKLHRCHSRHRLLLLTLVFVVYC